MHTRPCPWSSKREHIPKPAWIGQYGELVAASWLRAQGHKILRRNFRWAEYGEIDIVNRAADTLIFTEVKSRSTRHHGDPALAVGARKRALMREAALKWRQYLGKDYREITLQFDIIEVILQSQKVPEIRHISAAFGLQEGECRPLVLAREGHSPSKAEESL